MSAPSYDPKAGIASRVIDPFEYELELKPEKASRQSLTLRSAEFRKGREYDWRRLDDRVSRVEKDGISALSSEEIQELPLLYRSAVSSLSVARNIALDRNLLLYLENLTLRAYLVVYGPRVGMLRSLADFFKRGFPQAVRGMARHLAVVFAALLIGVIVGYMLTRADMAYFDMLVPKGLAEGRGPGSSASQLRDILFAKWPGFIKTFVVFANALFRHNAVIGLLCFGLGFALGVPTLLLTVYNGLIIGAFIMLHANHGLALDCLGWLLIHGLQALERGEKPGNLLA